MEEQFATYEIALELKELGFNGPCLCYYDKNKILCRSLLEYPIINSKNGFHAHWNIITAPLWQQVIDWFREKYRVTITIENDLTPRLENDFMYIIQGFLDLKNLSKSEINIELEFYNKDYNIIREQAILKAIELIKYKK